MKVRGKQAGTCSRATMSTMDAHTSRRVDAEIIKLLAETSKLNADAAMTRERWWYPVVLMSTAIGATAVLSKLVF